MFAYNPGVYDQSGEFLAKGALGAAQANQQMYEQIGEDVGGTIRKAGQAVAGFAMGGPAGAAMAMQGGGERGGRGGGGSSADSVLGSFVAAYADNKALEAKGSAYGDFMKRHGDQLGFDPEWIKGFLSESPRQQAMIGDSIIGMNNTGRSIMSQQIVDMQMNRGGSPGAGGGGGAGGKQQKGYVPGQGWVGYGN
jgi:hypothetical protein